MSLPNPEDTLGDRELPNAHELMENAAASKKRAVFHRHVTAEKTVVRDDHLVAEGAIMPEMRAGHEEIVVADAGRGTRGRAPMNGHMLANDIAVADFDRAASPGLETEILRRATDERTVSNLVIRPQANHAFDHGVRLDDSARSDFHFTADARKRPDLDVIAEACAGIDQGGGMDLHSTPVSLKLK